MKIVDKGKEYPNETIAIFDQLKRIADALEVIADIKRKEIERG